MGLKAVVGISRPQGCTAWKCTGVFEVWGKFRLMRMEAGGQFGDTTYEMFQVIPLGSSPADRCHGQQGIQPHRSFLDPALHPTLIFGVVFKIKLNECRPLPPTAFWEGA